MLKVIQRRLSGIDVGDETARGRQDTEEALRRLEENNQELMRRLRVLKAEGRLVRQERDRRAT